MVNVPVNGNRPIIIRNPERKGQLFSDDASNAEYGAARGDCAVAASGSGHDRGGTESGVLGETEHQIEVMHRLAGGALDQVVDDR